MIKKVPYQDGRLDVDYGHKLSNEEKEWLSGFNHAVSSGTAFGPAKEQLSNINSELKQERRKFKNDAATQGKRINIDDINIAHTPQPTRKLHEYSAKDAANNFETEEFLSGLGLYLKKDGINLDLQQITAIIIKAYSFALEKRQVENTKAAAAYRKRKKSEV